MKPEPQKNDDTEAILERRRFLIRSTLAGLGVAAATAVSGCDRPEKCLKVKPPDPKPKPPKDEPEPKVCLKTVKPGPPEPEPKPCLSIEAPEPPKDKPDLKKLLTPEDRPGPCLSIVPEEREHDEEKPRPKKCLSIKRP